MTPIEPTPEQVAMARRYEIDDRGLFCRHCGRAAWRHIRGLCDDPTAVPISGATALRAQEHLK